MTWHYSSWGALDVVTDIAGNSYGFTYNAKDELTGVTYPAGVTQTLAYDSGAECWPFGPLPAAEAAVLKKIADGNSPVPSARARCR